MHFTPCFYVHMKSDESINIPLHLACGSTFMNLQVKSQTRFRAIPHLPSDTVYRTNITLSVTEHGHNCVYRQSQQEGGCVMWLQLFRTNRPVGKTEPHGSACSSVSCHWWICPQRWAWQAHFTLMAFQQESPLASGQGETPCESCDSLSSLSASDWTQLYLISSMHPGNCAASLISTSLRGMWRWRWGWGSIEIWGRRGRFGVFCADLLGAVTHPDQWLLAHTFQLYIKASCDCKAKLKARAALCDCFMRPFYWQECKFSSNVSGHFALTCLLVSHSYFMNIVSASKRVTKTCGLLLKAGIELQFKC